MFVLLNTRTGELTAEAYVHGYQRRPDGWYDPTRDLWIIGYGWHRRPTILGWHTRGWEWSSTIEGVTAHLHRLVPTAQQLVDQLAPVAGTSDWEWTPGATAAVERITSGTVAMDPCNTDWDAPLPDRGSYGVVALSEILEHDPGLIDPTWASMSDAELDAVADRFAGVHGFGRSFRPTEAVRLALLERFKIGWYGGKKPAEPNNHSLYVVRARVDLRELRDRLITERTGLPTAPANTVYSSDHLPDGFTPGCSDDDLTFLAGLMDAEAAHTQKVSVTGTIDYLRVHRSRVRSRVRREAADAGRRVADLESQLVAARATRNGLVAQVIGFREEPEWDDSGINFAEVGRLAAMTRQGASAAFRSLVDEASDYAPAAQE